MDAVSLSIAVALAMGLAYVELRSRLRTRFTSRASGWWALRLGIEGFAASLFALLLPQIVTAGWINGPAGGFAAGASVPALLRLRLMTLKVGEATEIPIGIATAFEPIRDFFEHQIDEIGAVAQSSWLTKLFLELKQANWTLVQVEDRAKAYINGLSLVPATERSVAIAYIDARLDEKLGDDITIRLIVQKIVDLRGYRLLEDMLGVGPP